jgi:hypothetical protein
LPPSLLPNITKWYKILSDQSTMKYTFLLTVLLPLLAATGCGPRSTARDSRSPDTTKGVALMPKNIIRTIRMAHCARGPELCQKCREMDVPKICLLDIDPPDQGKVSRRTIEVQIDGNKAWLEFDVVKTFADEAEARKYAAKNGITDVEIAGHLDSAR